MIDIVLFLGAWAGHTAVWLFVLNRWYALAMPRRLLSAVRSAIALLILGGPAVFLLSYGLDFSGFLPLVQGPIWHTVLAAYLFGCWIVGFGLMPAAVIRSWRLGRSRFLLSNHTRTVDIRAELGHAPVGRGKYRLLAYLPKNEVFQVDFSERTLALADLPPAWDGLKILHLSDLHLCGTPDREFYYAVMDRCHEWDPDLVALTGDIVDSDEHHRWIFPVLSRLRWKFGAFAVVGNHDYWHDPKLVRRRLRRLNMRVLDNRWEQVEVRGVPLLVIGHEGPWFRPEPDLTFCPPNVFRLCLSHTPDNIGWARRNNIRLMLSGHNHGGQIRFPLIGSVFVPSLYGRRYDCGTFDEPPTLLHVSRGLAGKQPVRYNCRPEATLIILKNQPER
jgi:predicted MPP superfamily phosphohydrolase